jgi:Tol biopolymer transport system component
MLRSHRPKMARVVGAAVAFALGVLAPAVLPGPSATALSPGVRSKIAFGRYDSTTRTSDLFTMNADGAVQTRLTNGDANRHAYPAWSPDGLKIAFSCRTLTTGMSEICVVNADGSNQIQLTSDIDAITPAWSPDGSKIAFAVTNSGSSNGIYQMDTNGTHVARVSTGLDHSPSWSPDGSHITFQHWDSDSYTWEIYVIGADGTAETNLTLDLRGDDKEPSWSPDGSLIIFTSDRFFNDQIYVMNADGTVQRNLSRSAGNDTSPAWSPDGSMITFTTGRDGNDEIYVMNADGTDQIDITRSDAAEGGSVWGDAFTPMSSPPPELSGFDFTPKSIDLSTGAKTVVVSAHLSDIPGAAAPTVILASDTTTQTAGFGSMTLTSGTPQDGTWERTITIPATAAAGSWTVELYPLRDTLGNDDSTIYNHPAKLNVINPPASPPSVPSEVSATAGNTAAEVSWTKPASNGSPITGYTITASPGAITKTVSGADTTTATVTGLKNGTTYTFTVKAANAVGSSAASAPSNAVTPAAPVPSVSAPSAPRIGTASSGSSGGKITGIAAWKPPTANGTSPIVAYRLTASRYRANGAIASKTVSKRIPASSRRFQMVLPAKGRYRFTCTAYNASGASRASSRSNLITGR